MKLYANYYVVEYSIWCSEFSAFAAVLILFCRMHS